MGVDIHVFNFLCSFGGQRLGDMLCLGRQAFLIDRDGKDWQKAQEIFARYYPGQNLREAIGPGHYCEALFQFLGARTVRSLDVSAYEGADVIHDLNQPVPPELKQSFDCIFDGGTLEHVYNFPTAILNVRDMLNSGGLFLSVNGANNQLGHGFYQFSPELFWRVLSPENGFAVEKMLLVPMTPTGICEIIAATDPAGIREEIGRTDYPTYIMVAARSNCTRNDRLDVYQSDYLRIWNDSGSDHQAAIGDDPPELRIRFGKGGNSFRYPNGGWSYPEEGYAWALGPRATLVVPAPSRRARLEITGQPAIKEPILSQRVRIDINGTECAEYTLSTFSTISCVIPDAAGRTPRMQITLWLPDAFRPCELGDNPDDRLLGFAANEIAIICDAPTEKKNAMSLAAREGEQPRPPPETPTGSFEITGHLVSVSYDNVDPVILVQTADSLCYKEMLDLTARVNILYCRKRNFKYTSYVGVKRGLAPVHATFNKIFLLKELVDAGYAGWVLYLDADAFVANLDFDLTGYLKDKKDFCLIGAAGGEAEWNINAGVLLVNLSDPLATALIDNWLGSFNSVVPAGYLQNPEAKWEDFPHGDQPLLHDCIAVTPELLAKTKKDQSRLLNYVDGRFIRQAVRESFYDFHTRMEWIRSETDKIIARETRLARYQDLTLLADKYGSDKGDLAGNQHGYTRFYEFLFEGFRQDSFEFLELGLMRGGPEEGGAQDRSASDAPSVRMWLEYFPRAYCHGFDISDFAAVKLDRFRPYRGDMGNIDDLTRLRSELPDKLRFIVDDASHASYHQQLAFSHLFGLVERGGYYVIEDLDWQPAHIEQHLPRCALTRDVFLGFLCHGGLDIEFLPAAARAALAEQIGRVLVHRRRSDGTVKMVAVQRH